MERVEEEGEMGIQKSEGIRDEIQSAGVREKERGREGWKERGEERKKKERLRKGRVKRRAERVRGRGGRKCVSHDRFVFHTERVTLANPSHNTDTHTLCYTHTEKCFYSITSALSLPPHTRANTPPPRYNSCV